MDVDDRARTATAQHPRVVEERRAARWSGHGKTGGQDSTGDTMPITV